VSGVKLILDIGAFIAFVYLCLRFFRVLINMKQNVIFPLTGEEASSIRKHPEKVVDEPTYEKQKVGILMYSGTLLIIAIGLFLGIYFDIFNFSFIVVLPFIFSNSFDGMNLFTMTEKGILSGARFVPWDKVTSFHFLPIDVNHKYYGYSKEANDGYELKIKTKGIPISCIVTSEEMKERLDGIMSNRANIKVS